MINFCRILFSQYKKKQIYIWRERIHEDSQPVGAQADETKNGGKNGNR